MLSFAFDMTAAARAPTMALCFRTRRADAMRESCTNEKNVVSTGTMAMTNSAMTAPFVFRLSRLNIAVRLLSAQGNGRMMLSRADW